MLRLVALAAFITALVTAGSAAPAPGVPLLIGFSEDLPKEIGGEAAVAAATDLGSGAFRLTTLWSPGRTEPSAAENAKLQRATATAAAAGQRLVLSVYAEVAADAPKDAGARDAYCTYVRSLLVAHPSIDDVVIWNEPNKSFFWSPQAGAPAAYEALLARCYDVLHARFPSVNVLGLALSSTGNDNAGSTSPGEFIREVGEAYRGSGRTAPLLDTVAHHPYGMDAAERPWRKHIGSKTIALGDWNKLMANLALAFEGTGQPLPGETGTTIWYMESGSQTAVDPAKAGTYTGAENVATVPDDAGGEPDAPPPPETSPAPDQSTQALDAIRLAACQPFVAAYFNFLLADEPRLEGWQSGPYWADLTPKDSLPAFRRAIGDARAATVDCDTLKGGRPSADHRAPSVPADPRAMPLAEPLRVQVTWSPATDDASAVSYRVYRNGTHVGSTSDTTWTNVTVAPATAYTYVVRALDAAGNLGDASAGVAVTTPEESPPPPPPPPSGGGGGAALPPDLGVTLATVPAQPRAGASVDVLAVVSADPAGGSAFGVQLRVELPAGARLLGPPAFERGSGCSGESLLVCTLDFLPNGVATPVRFSLLAAQAGTLTATVASGQADSDPSDDRAAFAIAPAAVPAFSSQPRRANRAPTRPAKLRARVEPGRVTLRWGPSRDDRGVRAYLVFRDGKLRQRVRRLVARQPLPPGRHVYTVRAVDAAGKQSAPARVVVRRR
ncbi:MAG TPA: hypothetical protein VNP93_11950 [Gaiellaceae bacterium]|nr:hypothetical protein [Gaiellaceae bacterium]